MHVGARRRRASSVTSPTAWRPRPTLINVQPEHDLAVLQAQSRARRPRSRDDALRPAACGPGDEVVAVGFPFGIGPSASAGVVSGLEARVPLARGQAHPDQPDPVRRRGQPRQLGRAAGHDGWRGGRHRHRDR